MPERQSDLDYVLSLPSDEVKYYAVWNMLHCSEDPFNPETIARHRAMIPEVMRPRFDKEVAGSCETSRIINELLSQNK